MKKTLFFVLLLIISLSSCKSTEIQTKNISKNNKFLKINIKKSYLLEEIIKIKITNISGEKIVLYYPTKTRIQKKINSSWKNVRILNCPCDAPCDAPPEKIDFPNGKKINLSWNQKESFCGKMTDAGIRETISKNVDKGIYRLVIVYKRINVKKEIYNEFTIK